MIKNFEALTIDEKWKLPKKDRIDNFIEAFKLGALVNVHDADPRGDRIVGFRVPNECMAYMHDGCDALQEILDFYVKNKK